MTQKHFIDHTGQRFGRLVASRAIAERRHGKVVWEFRCDCGKPHRGLFGSAKSCGCLASDNARMQGRRSRKHGLSRTPEYRSWKSMMNRCNNPADPAYPRYGWRGITVCRRWRRFENFYSDMAPRPKGKTLDRKNNERGYSPSNCRWATPKEQAANRRRPLVVT